MPTVYSSVYTSGTKFYTDKGNLACVVASYTASALASGSPIYMIRIPAGARLVDGYWSTQGLGASVTVSMGDGTSATRFTAATAASSATLKRIDVAGSLPVLYTADNSIILTIGGASATGTVYVTIFYEMT